MLVLALVLVFVLALVLALVVTLALVLAFVLALVLVVVEFLIPTFHEFGPKEVERSERPLKSSRRGFDVPVTFSDVFSMK